MERQAAFGHRTVDRIYRLLSLIYPWKDIAAARWTLEHGDSRGRASALEYLDNLLTGPVRKRVLPVLEEVPLFDRALDAIVERLKSTHAAKSAPAAPATPAAATPN